MLSHNPVGGRAEYVPGQLALQRTRDAGNSKEARFRLARKASAHPAGRGSPVTLETATADRPGSPDNDQPGEEAGWPAVSPTSRERHQPARTNALGALIERRFSDPLSPCRSYSDLERRSRISREALSRYVTARPERRRSPTVDTLVVVADALRLSVDSVCRAAAASARGVMPPPEPARQVHNELLAALVEGLSDAQLSAIVELLRQMRAP